MDEEKEYNGEMIKPTEDDMLAYKILPANQLKSEDPNEEEKTNYVEMTRSDEEEEFANQDQTDNSEAITVFRLEIMDISRINPMRGITQENEDNITQTSQTTTGMLRRDDRYVETWQGEVNQVLDHDITTTWIREIQEIHRSQELMRLVVSDRIKVEMPNELWRIRSDYDEKILLPEGKVHGLINQIHKWLAHAGYQITYAFMKRYFWISNLRDSVIKAIDKCDTCNMKRYNKSVLWRDFDQEITETEKDVAIRLIGPLSISDRNVRFIVMISQSIYRSC